VNDDDDDDDDNDDDDDDVLHIASILDTLEYLLGSAKSCTNMSLHIIYSYVNI